MQINFTHYSKTQVPSMKNKRRSTVTFILVMVVLGFLTVPGLKAQNNHNQSSNYYVASIASGSHSKNANAVSNRLNNPVRIEKGIYQLGDLINLIASQVDLKPSYSKAFVPVDKKIRIPELETSAKEALSRVLKGTLMGFKVLEGKQLVFVKKIIPSLQVVQERVTGKVINSKTGKPIPNVNIIVRGTNTGTTTNADGHYSLQVPSLQDTLVFSYIGYQTKVIAINGRNKINVRLQAKSIGMAKLVVTALGRKEKKHSLGFSVQEVQAESFNKVKSPTVTSSLVGKVAGLNINPSNNFFQNAGISLRGRSPLIVVDGVPHLSGDLWKIRTANIKKVTVLKGGAATSLYGSKGRGGAILITTKKGNSYTGLHVEISSSTMFKQGFIVSPDVQTEFGEGDHGEYQYVNGLGGPLEGGGWMWGPRLDVKDPTTESGWVERIQYNSPIDPETGERIPIPWRSRGEHNIEHFFRTGILSNNSVSIGWGGEKGSFRTSITNTYQRGMVPNTSLNLTSLVVAGSINITDNFTAEGSLTYSKEATDNYPTVGYGPNNYLYNLMLWTGADVDVRDLQNYWRKGKKGYQQRNPNISYYNNPYFIAYEYLQGYYKDSSFGYLSFNYKVLPSLSIKFKSGGNVYGLTETTKEPKSYIAYGSKSRGNYYTTKTNYYNINSRLSATYNQDITSDLSLNVEVGASNNFNKYSSSYVHTDGLVIPGFYSLSNSAKSLQGSNHITKQQTNSLYGVIDMSYKQTYYLTITGRNDWVSTLPIDNNSFFYPSVSGSVILSEFLSLPSFMNSLTIRGSLSRISNGDVGGPYAYLEAYSTGINWGGSNPSLYIDGQLISPTLQPETSDMWEVGMQIGLFDSRLNIDMTYYQAKDYNNLVSISVSDASGYNSVLVNGNKFKRKGWEFIINAAPIQSSNLQWNLTFNISRYRRYLTDIYKDKKTLGQLHVGDRMDAIYASVYAESPKGKIIYKSNGFPKSDPFQRFIGYSNPDWIFGIQNSISYHNFTLLLSFDGQIGGLNYSTLNQKMWWGGKHPGTVNKYRVAANHGKETYVAPGVVVTGGEVVYDSQGNVIKDTRTLASNTTPVDYIAFMKSTSNAMYHNYHYYNTTYLKLREASLTYRISQEWLENFSIQSASVALVARNLFLLSSYPNSDPSTNNVGDLNIPSTRSIGFNINITF